jgi:DNA-binding NtrC family response regulator
MASTESNTHDEPFHGLIGKSAGMRALYATIARVAPHFSTALVTGATGTGKELVARALYRLSPRTDRAFVAVNCSAIVETLFESELFGHVRGAFTGATEHRIGLYERASGGVLFLDEVGELPATAQAKLLRVLETGEVMRVGASETRRVDVRVIAATNRALGEEVRAGRFRADLYYRLNVVELAVPALKDRDEDIRVLARHFAREFGRQFHRGALSLSPEAEALLGACSWPGNVRELKNVIERAAMLGHGSTIEAGDLRMAAPPAGVLEPPRSAVCRIAELERREIQRALVETNGNKKEAARRLGISRRALYRRLEKFDLTRAA